LQALHAHAGDCRLRKHFISVSGGFHRHIHERLASRDRSRADGGKSNTHSCADALEYRSELTELAA